MTAPHADMGAPGQYAAADEAEYEPADADTFHHLIVDFRNAPQGMRADLRNSRGPSDLTVRTQTAFEAA